MRLLVVEDEDKAAQFLKKGLGEAGYVVDTANNGLDGFYMAQEVNYDLIVLDIMLPKMDGWAVLEKLRQIDQETPVLLLTARDGIEDRVKGLNLGADDYLVKPFVFSELQARVHALLRRGKVQQQTNILALDNLEVDVMQRKITRGGKRIVLSPKEFSLLSLLLRRQGQVLSRTVIAEQVWDMNFDSDTNVVDVAVKRLRNKIDDPFETKLIHTARGIGYVMEKR